MESSASFGCFQKTNRSQKMRVEEIACHNIMTTIPVFQRQKSNTDITLLAGPPACWMQIAYRIFANWFKFQNGMQAACWCASVASSAAADCALWRAITPKADDSELLNNQPLEVWA